MAEKHKLVLLPSETGRMAIAVGEGTLHYNNYFELSSRVWKPRQLFILSNEPIKQKDWFIPKCVSKIFDNKPIQFIEIESELIDCIKVTDGAKEYTTTKTLLNNAKKIIASMNKEITPAFISDEFAGTYTMHYESDKVITEVEIEGVNPDGSVKIKI